MIPGDLFPKRLEPDSTYPVHVFEVGESRLTPDRPWVGFFLIREESEDVYASTDPNPLHEVLTHVTADEVIHCPLDVGPEVIRGRYFVSLRALARLDPECEEMRTMILRRYRACRLRNIHKFN